MPESRPRSLLASAVGWLIVLVIAWVFFGSLIGTLAFLVRMLLFLLVIGGLLVVYFKLRDGD